MQENQERQTLKVHISFLFVFIILNPNLWHRSEAQVLISATMKMVVVCDVTL
jgi:hypothetical protein